MDTLNPVDADRALKAKHRAIWAMGDYPLVVTTLVSGLGPALVTACGVQPGDRVLDVAAGTGNAAIPAAAAGAHVVAADLTPELFVAGRTAAAERGVELDWVEADAEALPFVDDQFDVVMSCLGVMFAPHHRVVADELVRICRPGGRIGLLSWTPGGFIGEMFATIKPYAPAPPPGALPPPLWGDEQHVLDLLDGRVTDVVAQRRMLAVDHFATPEEFRDFVKTFYGPVVAVYRSLGADVERLGALDRDLAALAARHLREEATAVMEWEYLLLTARTLAGA